MREFPHREAPCGTRAIVECERAGFAQGARASAHLFPGARGGKLSGMAMAMLMRRMKVDATVHGFRSGFRDWAAECTSYAHEVAEMALAHTIENKVERAYRRGDLFDKRRRLMDDWAAYCASNGVANLKVSPIRKAATR